MTPTDLGILADRVATAACREVPPHLCEIRADVYKAARRAALDALENAEPPALAILAGGVPTLALVPVEPPCTSPSGVHSPAYCPRHGRDECWRCHAEVRYGTPPPPEERPATPTWVSATGRHEWPVFDEADTAPPNGVPAPSPALHDAPAPGPVTGEEFLALVDSEGPLFPAPSPDDFGFDLWADLHYDADGASL